MTLDGLAVNALPGVLLIPAVAAAVFAALPNYWATAWLNVLATALTLICALSLLLAKPQPGPYLLVDDLNGTFIVLTTFVAFTTSIFSASYIGHELDIGRLTPSSVRFYHAMYQVMMFAMNLALVSNNIGLMWVAIELATLTTVLMVGIYRTHEALEAAWKYFILGSVGIALALFGTILVYMAARPVVGEGLDAMVWSVLVTRASAFDPALLDVAFVFLLLGYGTKVGLAPLHAWLPDAHAEGPTPISAVLSGLLLNVALYALLRFKMLLAANAGALAPGPLMVTLGLLSLVFAAFMLYRRRDIKRMFAYSSIEHMGIITFAFGMGGPIANFAGLLHMTMHSLTKSAIFFAVGHVTQVKGTQRIADMGGLTETHPVLGWGLILGVVAIAGLPPLGIFMSEFLVVSSTFAREPLLAIILVFGILVGVAGLFLRLNGIAFGEPRGSSAKAQASYIPMFSHLALVLAAGVYLPPVLVVWFQNVARLLGRQMPALIDIIEGKRVEDHRPWPRLFVTPDGWRKIANEIAAGRATLLGVWGDSGTSRTVHMAFIEQDSNDIAVVSLECPDKTFPSVGALHPPAIRLERALHSLYGLQPVGAPDTRPWLDLGCWDVKYPLGSRKPAPDVRPAYTFLPVEGESLHQIPVGPVHASIIEPGHFRFTASGETVVRLEARLGYAHKGIESLMVGATIERAAQLAARTSGDSTVAYGIAFAHAVEAALNVETPPRAQYLRALMAELERLANHFGDIGAICNDASFPLMHAHCGILREMVLRAADACFGHRLMMYRVIPGGVTNDLSPDGVKSLKDALLHFRQRFPRLIELYDNTASLQDRTVGTGIVRMELAQQFGASGYVGRASGRDFDARKTPGYAPYIELDFTVPVLTEGDVNARVWVRIREVEQSLALIEQIIERLPGGPIVTTLDGSAGEGLGFAEGFRGDVLVSLRIEGERIMRCHLRDPSWFQWPLVEAAIESNIVADFPLCNKSFNCSYSGHDL